VCIYILYIVCIYIYILYIFTYQYITILMITIMIMTIAIMNIIMNITMVIMILMIIMIVNICACIGLSCFLSVATNERCETYHCIDWVLKWQLSTGCEWIGRGK
jgi:hypothetical protein